MRFSGLLISAVLSLLVSCQRESTSATTAPEPSAAPESTSVPVAPPQAVPASASAAPATSSSNESTDPAAPPLPAKDQIFGWPQIKSQIDFGLATRLRNYDLTQDQWNRAVKGYQDKAVATIAKKKYATPELVQALQDVPRPFLAYNYETDQQKTNIVEDYGTIIDIGYGATMSAPSIQAFMTAQLNPTKDMVALEIGTGSGSQAVFLSYLVKQVYTIEVRQSLGQRVSKVLKNMGYSNIETKIGDGYYGWKEKAPFDIIIVTCQASHIPPALVDQLKPNGVMVIPVGPAWSQNQQMLKVWKDPATGKIVSRRILAKTSFIPMLGIDQGRS